MTKEELKAELEELGVEYPVDAKKAELEELLEAATETLKGTLEEDTLEEEEILVDETEKEFPYTLKLEMYKKTITVVGETTDKAGRKVLKAADGCTYHAE